MQAPQITPFQFDDHEVRTLLIDGEPWFVATDICKAVGIAQAASAMRVLDDDEKGVHLTHTLGGEQSLSVISESGMFTLTLRCRNAVKPGTVPHRFRKWVTSEVLPSIRKTGRYETAPALPAPIQPIELPPLCMQRWLTTYDSKGGQHTRLLPMDNLIMSAPDFIEHVGQMSAHQLPTDQLFALTMQMMAALHTRKVNFAGYAI